MSDVQSRLAHCFAIVFPALDDTSIREATVSSVEDWDSMATVNLIHLVEEEFQLVVDIDDVESLVSFTHFLKYVCDRRPVTYGA